jgi:hypothetical protein
MTVTHAQAAVVGEDESRSAARLKARIIIPVWGAKYVERLGSACLPALLAPGNLPYLAEHFECELVVVTESRLFDAVRALEAVRRAQRWCGLRLVAIDDVLSHPSYYGLTITHALYRGFTDLGDAAKYIWCFFLNADFILADGSYRSLVSRIRSGARCILSPSYCTIEETVWPVLNERVAAGGGVLAMPPREMAGLIIDNRHFTIRAKTINWRMYRIDHVDQFYYVVDRDTILARQIPIAVVAFRPERVPPEPVGFWDYGVLSEVCPTAELCVLGDSDEFLMLEMRTQGGMGDWLKLGWLDPDEIAAQLSQWSTRDQRRCGAYTLKLHRADLPCNLEQGMKVLDAYYRDIEQRLAPEPRDHRNHYIWTQVVDCHKQWLDSRNVGQVQVKREESAPNRSVIRLGANLMLEMARALARGGGSTAYRRLHDVFRAGYRLLYGRLPDVGLFHPYRADLRRVVAHIKDSASSKARVLSVCSSPASAVASQLSRWFPDVISATPDELMSERAVEELVRQGPFDLCFLELTREEFFRFSQFHRRLQPVVGRGSEILAFYRTRGTERISQRELALIYRGLPASDLPELEFRGGSLTYLIQAMWESALDGMQGGSIRALLKLASVALVLGPLAVLATWRSLRRPPGRFVNPCTSLFLRVKVI